MNISAKSFLFITGAVALALVLGSFGYEYVKRQVEGRKVAASAAATA